MAKRSASGRLALALVEARRRAERAHLGHAPALDDFDAVLLPEALDHGERHGRAADQGALDRRHLELVLGAVLEQGEPHRRHAGAQGDLLLVQKLVDAGAVELGSGEDQLGAAHRRGIDQAPGIGVEHRHHRQQGGVGIHRDHRAVGRHDRMDHRRAVRVEHALGVARRARGVAERRCRLLVEVGPFQRARLVRDQLLVAQQVRDLGRGRHVGAVGHDHDMLHRLEMRPHALDDRQQVEVDEDRLVLGVVGDVGDVLGRQPRVDRVQHGADAGDAEIELEVAIGVPGDGADRIAELDAQPLQGLGELLGALGRVLVAVAVDRPLDRAGHDLDVGVVPSGKVDDLRNQQRTVLHQAEHGVSSVTLAARNEGFCDWGRLPRSVLDRVAAGREAARRRHSAA